MIHAKPRQKLGIERKQFIHFNLMVWEDAREKLKKTTQGTIQAQNFQEQQNGTKFPQVCNLSTYC